MKIGQQRRHHGDQRACGEARPRHGQRDAARHRRRATSSISRAGCGASTFPPAGNSGASRCRTGKGAFWLARARGRRYFCREEGAVYVARIMPTGLRLLNETRFDDAFVASPRPRPRPAPSARRKTSIASAAKPDVARGASCRTRLSVRLAGFAPPAGGKVEAPTRPHEIDEVGMASGVALSVPDASPAGARGRRDVAATAVFPGPLLVGRRGTRKPGGDVSRRTQTSYRPPLAWRQRLVAGPCGRLNGTSRVYIYNLHSRCRKFRAAPGRRPRRRPAPPARPSPPPELVSRR